MPAIRGPDAPSHNGGRSPAYGPPSQGVLDGVRQLVCSDEPVAAAGDGDRTLGHRPQGQARHPQERRLLLYPGRVSDRRRRAAHQGHELQVAERLAHPDARVLYPPLGALP
jgi:hypothetical protein